MTLAEDYLRQFAWRAWPTIFDALPRLHGKTVLDLGCGVGDQAAELARRGARVIAIDANEELLRAARERQQGDIDFRLCDLRALPRVGPVDGLWSSFTAAYFPKLDQTLRGWARNLGPNAWLSLTEVDDLFGHEPLSEATRSLLTAYARDSLAAGRYDFHMGGKLRGILEVAGFSVERVLVLPDRELAFNGPAEPAVLQAWRTRLSRMKLLQDFCGSRFAALRDELLACLALPEHRSKARVVACIARAP
jgi:SAM-dependent methyltransferase